MNESTTLRRLQDWYVSNCRSDWAQSHGVRIENISNPGWTLTVDLEGTQPQDAVFEEISVERVDDDSSWYVCKREGLTIKGYCEPRNLEELLTAFLEWRALQGDVQAG